MSFRIENIIENKNKPFIYVDFNEIFHDNTIMLSQNNNKNDILNNKIEFIEWLEIIGYQQDEDTHGNRDDIIVEGVCIRNETGSFNHVKWLLKPNSKGIRYVSDIILKGW